MTIEELIETYASAVDQKVSFISLKVKRKKVTSERIRVAPGLMGKLMCVNSKNEVVVRVATQDLKRFIDKAYNQMILEAAK